MVENRHLCVTHFGSGVGSNAWATADCVILCDEWHLPQLVAVANTQGYLEHRATVSGNDKEYKNCLGAVIDVKSIVRVARIKQWRLVGCVPENH